MVITIDGPAGAGKSTVARLLAKELGFEYLDTGAMYRAVALAGLRAGIDFQDSNQLAELARNLRIEFRDNCVFLNGEDITQELRTPAVTRLTQFAADNHGVRQHLIELQRRFALGRNVVTEGRDQGSLVFPDAAWKFYLTASPEERARRRVREYQAMGKEADFQSVLGEILSRDRKDSEREFGGLVCPPGALEVNTDGKTVEQVVGELRSIITGSKPREFSP